MPLGKKSFPQYPQTSPQKGAKIREFDLFRREKPRKGTGFRTLFHSLWKSLVENRWRVKIRLFFFFSQKVTNFDKFQKKT